MIIRALYRIIQATWGNCFGIWVFRVVKLLLNIFYPIYLRFAPYSLPLKSTPEVIVSLTSFPARIDKLWIVIEILLRQTYKPYKILLWLAEDQFESVEVLPKSLTKLQEKGLEIRFCQDIKSHKKYFYVMQEYPEYSIITVDDDTFYPEDLIEDLVKCSDNHSGIVCCNLAHQILFRDGFISDYADWKSGQEALQGPSKVLLPIGCGGVLYPPGSLDKKAFNRRAINRLCPIADDLWLKAMSTLNGVSAMRVHSYSFPFANFMYSHKSKNFTLSELNNEQKMNDVQLGAILREYPELIEKLSK